MLYSYKVKKHIDCFDRINYIVRCSGSIKNSAARIVVILRHFLLLFLYTYLTGVFFAH